MRVRYGPRALAQLEEIISYIARNDPAAARRLVARIEHVAMLLGQFPLMGRTTRKRDVRVFGVPNYPYIVFYRIVLERDEIRILHVRHTARRPLGDYR